MLPTPDPIITLTWIRWRKLGSSVALYWSRIYQTRVNEEMTVWCVADIGFRVVARPLLRSATWYHILPYIFIFVPLSVSCVLYEWYMVSIYVHVSARWKENDCIWGEMAEWELASECRSALRYFTQSQSQSQSQSYFTNGGLPPICSSWWQTLWDSRPVILFSNCGYVISSLTRWWVCRLQLLLALASAVILKSESRGTHDHLVLSQIRDSPNLEGQVPVFISPRNSMARLYARALRSFA
jgi:hypothetical protein